MRRFLIAVSLSLILFGCGKERLGPERVTTVPVSGTVLVDGKPTPDVVVTLHVVELRNEGGVYTSQPQAITDKEGKFAISTYEEADGVAAGTYAVTFEWLTYNVIRNQWGGKDKLNGRYSDPKATEFKVEATGDEEEPIVLEPYKLTTK